MHKQQLPKISFAMLAILVPPMKITFSTHILSGMIKFFNCSQKKNSLFRGLFRLTCLSPASASKVSKIDCVERKEKVSSQGYPKDWESDEKNRGQKKSVGTAAIEKTAFPRIVPRDLRMYNEYVQIMESEKEMEGERERKKRYPNSSAETTDWT